MESTPASLQKYIVISALCWTVVIFGSLVWFYIQENQNNLEIAKAEARIAFQKDTLYRSWVSKHGGVYVPASAETPPNPNLSHIPERDITTPSGKALTLINPAYMTRQVFEQADKETNYVKGHITSLKPIRPENAPDTWEQEALKAFENGSNEVSGIQEINGQRYLRLMRPFMTDQPCLKCHAAQGYKLGDIRGGISVSVPMRLFSTHSSQHTINSALAHGAIWLIGLTAIIWGGRRLKNSYALLCEKNEELLNEVQERQAAQESLQEQAVQLEEEISERQRAQEQLEQEIAARIESEKMLLDANAFDQQILNNDVVGIVVYNNDLRYRVWNRFMENLTGIQANDVLGQRPEEVFPFLDDCGVVDRITRALAGDIPEPVEFKFDISSTGKTGYAYDLIVPLKDTSGSVIGAVAMILNITKQRELEDQLRHSQKMETIGQLAGGVAHDFNNILTVIGGYASLLAIDSSVSKSQSDAVNQISESVDRAANLTRGLLNFSRKEPLKFSTSDINSVVQQVVKFLQRIIGENIQLKLILYFDKLMVKADVGQLEQVLINLAANARDAMPNGGVLSIETSIVHWSEETEGCSAGQYALITVTDNGTGMNQETTERIFEPFFTTKEASEGTGLGMAIVQSVVKQHNGFITCWSELEKGTTFKVYIPILNEGTVDKDNIEQLAPVGGNETILLVEDDEQVRRLIKSVLIKFGYDVIEAIDGLDALNKFSENRDDIQLILMDIFLPHKNGNDVGKEILQNSADMKIIYMSGYSGEYLESHGIDNIADFISKPIKPLELLAKMRTILDKHL